MTEINQRGHYGRFVANLLSLSDFVVISAVYGLIVLLNREMLVNHPKLIGLLVNVAYVPSAWFLREVRNARSIHMDHIIWSALRAVGIHAMFFFSLLFFLELQINMADCLELYGGMLTMLPLWWIISRMLLKSYRRRGRNFSRVAIVGTGPTARRLYEELHSDPGYGYKFKGFIDYGYAPDFPYPTLYASNMEGLEDFVREHHIDGLFYTLSGEDEEALRRTISVCDHNIVQFYFVPQLSRFVTRTFLMHSIGTVPVMTVRNNPLTSIVRRGLKRFCDIVISSAVMIVSPVVLIPVAIAIKISSPGPIFFKQRRTGYRGHDFLCYKFRTMRVNDSSDTAQASKDDPRKTRVGDFLRRTSIDELPQFFNVLKGDMSIVGPRPHMLAHTRQYSRLIDKYMIRHLVKPGITGWAQVNGYRGQTEQLWQMEKRVEYDMWYIENWSLMLDFKIMARTVINALHGEENAF